MTLYAGFISLAAGLSVGLSGLAAGFAVGVVGDAGVRGSAQQPRLFVGMILILIFAEVLGLYGLIGNTLSYPSGSYLEHKSFNWIVPYILNDCGINKANSMIVRCIATGSV